MTAESIFPIPAAELIPHRPPLQLVDALQDFDGETGTVSAAVAAGNPLLEADGSLAEVALLELLAQTYATVQGYVDRQSNQPVRQGFLVGVRQVAFAVRPRLGDRLQVRVRTAARLDGFAIVEGDVRRADEVLAEGNIKLWIAAPQGEAD